MNTQQAQDLKRLAEAATPGPWPIGEDDYGDEHWFGGSGDGQVFVNGFVSGGCKRNTKKWAQLKADAAYISAMSPDVALQLLADRAMLIYACGHYEAALHEAFPAGAYGHAFEHWNDARRLLNERDALAASKE